MSGNQRWLQTAAAIPPARSQRPPSRCHTDHRKSLAFKHLNLTAHAVRSSVGCQSPAANPGTVCGWLGRSSAGTRLPRIPSGLCASALAASRSRWDGKRAANASSHDRQTTNEPLILSALGARLFPYRREMAARDGQPSTQYVVRQLPRTRRADYKKATGPVAGGISWRHDH